MKKRLLPPFFARAFPSAWSLALALLILLDGGTSPRAQAPNQQEFYVSPTGADTNPGSRDQPFLTLTRARDAVRAIARPLTGDIVVNLRGGTYSIAAPIEFGPADSGNNGFRVVYRAFEMEKPVLSGGVRVSGWSLDHGNVYKAQLNRNTKLRSLFVNGVRANMPQATFKGHGPWGTITIRGDEPWAETPGKTYDGIRFDAKELPVLGNPADVELCQPRSFSYLVLCARDIAAEGDQTIVKLQQPYGAIASTMAWKCCIGTTGTLTIRNAYEFLKNPGEFYFNRAAQTLYYIPREGEDMAKAEVIAPLSEGLVRIKGDSTGARVKNLDFVGLTFTHDDWLLKKVGGTSRGMNGVQSLALYTRFRADGNWHRTHYNLCDLPRASVELSNCENVRFERNRFVHLNSGSAISLINDAADIIVRGNVFDDLLGNAVNVGHPQHYIIGDGPLFKEGIEGVCARVKIQNNWIRRVSLDFKQQEAISGFFTEAVEIGHNDVRGTPYGGIALGWWWGNGEIPASTVPKNNVIARNRIADTQQGLPRDGGAIYVLGQQPGGRIEGNYVRSNTRCIYADDGSAYWTISNNVVDPRITRRDVPRPRDGMWLFLWTPRIHDLTIDNNYSTIANARNDATDCQPTNTHFEEPFSAAAQAIIDAAGLEPAYKDIAEGE